MLYLILSHRDPSQVLRLARRLISDDPGARVVIHHDASQPAFEANEARIAFVREPVHVAWGDISVVAALLQSLDWIEHAGIAYRWLVLLSGQDYPTGSVCDLEATLEASGADGFIEHAAANAAFAAENHTRYFFNYRRLPDALAPVARRLWRINALQPFVRVLATRAGCYAGTPARTPFGRELHCYRGSFWWTLSRGCIVYLRAFVAAHPDLVEAFSRKLVPDEAFVPSILASAGRFELVAGDPRHIVWPRGHDGSPAILRAKDYASITASGKSFARKFDAQLDARILDQLDEHVHSHRLID